MTVPGIFGPMRLTKEEEEVWNKILTERIKRRLVKRYVQKIRTKQLRKHKMHNCDTHHIFVTKSTSHEYDHRRSMEKTEKEDKIYAIITII